VEIVEDVWLSERFGHPVFTLRDLRSTDDPEALRRHVSGSAAATYQAKVATEDVRMVRLLSSLGFYVVNTTLTLGRECAPPPADVTAEVEVSEAVEGEEQQLLGIAASCFRFNRFHLDPAISQALADGIKRAWVENYLRGDRGERLLVARTDGEVAGFLAELAGARDGRRAGTVDLMGIDVERQGSGVGRALLRRFILDSGDRYEVLLVGTQAANLPAVLFYESERFRLVSSTYDLHMHVPAPGAGG
jgi:ribosomal protein S18 acetylase RimI-like enzyme